jgi:hypothetical protein
MIPTQIPPLGFFCFNFGVALINNVLLTSYLCLNWYSVIFELLHSFS